MIKGLPKQWYVYVPTMEISEMILEKLFSFGYSLVHWETLKFPYIIASSTTFDNRVTNFQNIDDMDRDFGRKEITLRAILEGEIDKAEEKSFEDKLNGLLHAYHASLNSVTMGLTVDKDMFYNCHSNFIRALTSVILEEARKGK